MHIKIGFVNPPNATIKPDFEQTYKSIVKRSRPSLVSAPPVRISDARCVM
jgi:phosphatidylserine decarboxylase